MKSSGNVSVPIAELMTGYGVLQHLAERLSASALRGLNLAVVKRLKSRKNPEISGEVTMRWIWFNIKT
ncbi:MAG: hypothetical protein PHO08_02265 [Methylococcales bacterium]|nr:hypothetical protein [Methylococcales bacterium]MDD5632101.1 hypothetical protein [Methylococcales bacterium]